MAEHELTPITTGQVKWTVHVDDHGYFSADADGFRQVTSATYDGLREQCKVRASQARVKVDIPFTEFSWKLTRPVARHWTATGIHGSNNNVLYRDENGKSGQLDTYRHDRTRPMAPEDEGHVLRLMEDIHKLDAERREIIDRYRFDGNLRDTVQRAVTASVAELLAKQNAEAGEDA